ncbi:MAG: site-2 protease family protein [Lachnospiraceae bacterium]|nr:site-2 protease family protein [Lachnospiraceae bacterium]
MNIVIKILLAVLIFGILVFSHEFGHFLIAKANGIAVNEFWIGFGPKIFSFKKNETLYRINLLPLGGGCLFDNADPEHLEESTYRNAPVFSRMATVLAGPFFNFILAFILALFVVGQGGGYQTAVLLDVTEGSPAEAAGLRAGDDIRKFNGTRVHMFSEVTLLTMFSDGQESTIEFERDGQIYQVSLSPKYNEEYGRYMFGIVGGDVDPVITPLKSLRYAYYYVIYEVKSVVKSLEWLVLGKLSAQELSGPIGMATIVSDEYDYAKEAGGWTAVILTMVSLGSLLSANLGAMNLLPVPGLDGGKFLLLIVEAFRRKPLSTKTEGAINLLGVVLLLALMVFVMYNDIARLIMR